MTSAREDFDTAVTLLADMLEERLEGEVDFADDFLPWEFLRETMPSLADRLQEEGSAEDCVSIEEVRNAFLENDPNNASRMRGYIDSL